MKTAIVSIYGLELEQALPLFAKHIQSLEPKPDKIILFDLFEQKELEFEKVKQIFEVRSVVRESNVLWQFQKIRIQVAKELQAQGFGAIFFLQPNIFPPKNVLEKMVGSKKEIISPALYSIQNERVYSNAFKKLDSDSNATQRISPVFFEETIPSGQRKVFGVSFEAVFLAKNAFSCLDFGEAKNAFEEMVLFSKKCSSLGKDIFIDSSAVCAKHGLMQLFSYYYSNVQNPLLL